MFACLADLNHIAYDVVAMCAGTAKATVATVVCAVAVAKFVRMTPIGNHTCACPVKRINSTGSAGWTPMGCDGLSRGRNPLWD